jgi:hypothetical protein
MVCSICHEPGHNKTTCELNDGSQQGPKKKKRRVVRVRSGPGMIPYLGAGGSIFFEPEQEKVQCGCGGSHLPCGTAKGAASWRAHHSSDRHMRWFNDGLY